MDALRRHLLHHGKHMLGCLAGALIAVVGGVVHEPIVAITGSVICGVFCLQMIRMIAFRPKRAHHV